MVTGLIAFALLTLSWPQLRASFRFLPVDRAVTRYWKTETIPSAQLPQLISTAEAALAIHDNARYWNGVSFMHYLYAIDDNSPSLARRPAFEKSLDAAVEVLKRAPAKPKVWLRLARIRALLEHPPEQVLRALKMSILMGRVQPTLLLSRLQIGYYYMPMMDDDDLLLMRDQTLLTWKLQPREMANMLTNQQADYSMLRELLADRHPEIMRQIEVRLEQAE